MPIVVNGNKSALARLGRVYLGIRLVLPSPDTSPHRARQFDAENKRGRR